MKRLWQRFWDRAPRQLTFTREGKTIVGLAIAVGFAAINTGNNLMFLGWGLVLSAIVLSGILSEGVLRSLWADIQTPEEARVGEPAFLPAVIHNQSPRFPSYGIELCASGVEGSVAAAPYLLRLSAGDRHSSFARFTPEHRGLYVFDTLEAKTRFPFGFFEKSRRFSHEHPLRVWVYPQRVDVTGVMAQILASEGEVPSGRVGRGDEFYSLRSHRRGDDFRRVNWRRSARTGRWVTNEYEALRGRQVALWVFCTGADESADEDAIATAGSLAEALLELDYAVGLVAPGVAVAPQGGAGARLAILQALAQTSVGDALPGAKMDATTAIGIRAEGATDESQHCQTVVDAIARDGLRT